MTTAYTPGDLSAIFSPDLSRPDDVIDTQAQAKKALKAQKMKKGKNARKKEKRRKQAKLSDEEKKARREAVAAALKKAAEDEGEGSQDDDSENGEEKMKDGEQESKGAEGSDDNEDDDEDDDGESDSGSDSESDDDDDDDEEEEENKGDRAKRTIFVGNVVNTITKQQMRKAFGKYGAIESVRFRSISFSDPKVPRGMAYNQGLFHEKRDTMNAYVVFKEAESAAKATVKNNKKLMGKTVRVDSAVPKENDTKMTAFVGNMPFDAVEEEVREFFKDNCGKVDAVRLIRDRASNMGKGFGYVTFFDQKSLKRALAFKTAKFKGRKLRITKAVTKERLEGGARRTRGAETAKPVGKKGLGKKGSKKRGGGSFRGAQATKGQGVGRNRKGVKRSGPSNKGSSRHNKKKRPDGAGKRGKKQ